MSKNRSDSGFWPSFADLMLIVAVFSMAIAVATSEISSKAQRESEQSRRKSELSDALLAAVQASEQALAQVCARPQLRAYCRYDTAAKTYSFALGERVIRFDTSQATIRWMGDGEAVLGAACEALVAVLNEDDAAVTSGSTRRRRGEFMVVEISGHTDSTRPKDGNEDYNWNLSTRRADALMSYMRGNPRCAGLLAYPVRAVGYADSRPVRPNAIDETSRAENRRVELRLVNDLEKRIRLYQESQSVTLQSSLTGSEGEDASSSDSEGTVDNDFATTEPDTYAVIGENISAEINTTAITQTGLSDSEATDTEDESTSPVPDADMVSIPAGVFIMGCNEEADTQCEPDERPSRRIYVRDFRLDRREVTAADFQACVRAGECDPPGAFGSCLSEDTQRPVVCVDWRNAARYCRWRGKRLPTEAEWEKAARGTDGRLYPWGNEQPGCKRAVIAECEGKEVDRQAGASPYGALDMAGNVMEWVADGYGSLPSPDSRNPYNSASYPKVLRGGSWSNDASQARASFRNKAGPDTRSEAWGFRCASGIAIQR